MSERGKACAISGHHSQPSPAFIFSDRNNMSIDALYRALNTRSSIPQTTVEAIMFAHERGLAPLEEAANVERLVRCDRSARAQINLRIARLLEQRGSPR
jgi:hypothetical protein